MINIFKKENIMRNFILYLILLCPYIASAEITSPKVKNYIATLEAKEHKAQGGAIAILHKGVVIYKKTFGHAKENSEPITSNTLFPLASVSKVISSAAVALMVDKKEIDLNKQYSFPYLKSKVNLRNILGNTAGYRFNGNQDIEAGITRAKLLEKIKTLPQSCQPGQCYFYSNACFSLVDNILKQEKSSLKYAVNNLASHLKTDEIQMLPLGKEAHIAYPHIKNKQKDGFTILPFPPYYPKTVPAAAGIFASIDGMIELYKFLFFYRPDLIANETLEIFYAPYIEAYISHWKLPYEKEIESYYGLGWRIFKSKTHKDKDFIFHGGAIAGINAFIGFIPSEEIGIIILMNEPLPSASKRGLEFWREFLK
jgi:beta-lactamase class C